MLSGDAANLRVFLESFIQLAIEETYLRFILYV